MIVFGRGLKTGVKYKVFAVVDRQQGNNVINGGYAAQEDGWIYYSNESDKYKSYKIRPDGRGRSLVQ